MMSEVYGFGRLLVPVVFIADGIQKVSNVGAIAKALAERNVPVPEAIVPYLGGMPGYDALGYLIGGLEIVCGLLVAAGLAARWGALVLIVFAACTIIFVHPFWAMEGAAARASLTEALTSLSLIGALLLVVAVGSRISYETRPTT